MSISIHQKIEEVGSENWALIRPKSNPFQEYDFLYTLESSKSVGKGTGWLPRYLSVEDGSRKGLLYYFEKTNSYGEYIFDWQWSEAYHRNGIPYYPKFTSMIPFTPATTPHFLMNEFDEDVANSLLDHYEDVYTQSKYSSSHFLFLPTEEIPIFRDRDYLIRESFQYHFFNDDYESFEQMLSKFKTKKAKQIRKERIFDEDICIECFTDATLGPEHALQMYEFYKMTIQDKRAIDYLSKEFFVQIFDKMKSNVLFVQASKEGDPIAGALYFYDSERLYGRYWGAKQNVPNLHFELCYYRGIEFCLEKNLKVFEAGAQGEHKIARGFKPIKTYSAHKIRHPEFNEAIKRYILEEKQSVDLTIEHLNSRLPFIIEKPSNT